MLTRSLFCALLLSAPCVAQMKTGAEMPGYPEVFGLEKAQQSSDYKVEEIAVEAGVSTMVNVLWPGESLSVTLHFVNESQSRLKAHGKVNVVSYGTSVPLGDVWAPHVFKIAEEGSAPFDIDLPASGSQDITLRPEIPERFGEMWIQLNSPAATRQGFVKVTPVAQDVSQIVAGVDKVGRQCKCPAVGLRSGAILLQGGERIAQRGLVAIQQRVKAQECHRPRSPTAMLEGMAICGCEGNRECQHDGK